MSVQDQGALARNISDRGLARITGIVLRGGVIISGALVLIGVILYLAGDNSGAPKTLDEVTGKAGTTYDVSVTSIVDGLASGTSTSFIELGLLVLILTPTVRVAITAWYMARNQERILFGMAMFVLIVLVFGLIGIGA